MFVLEKWILYNHFNFKFSATSFWSNSKKNYFNKWTWLNKQQATYYVWVISFPWLDLKLIYLCFFQSMIGLSTDPSVLFLGNDRSFTMFWLNHCWFLNSLWSDLSVFPLKVYDWFLHCSFCDLFTLWLSLLSMLSLILSVTWSKPVQARES